MNQHEMRDLGARLRARALNVNEQPSTTQASETTCMYGYRLDETCRADGCTAAHEPPAPRAGERNTQSQLFPRYSFAIITGRYKILDNRAESKFPQIATADGEEEARTIVRALNAAEQHATLAAQRERLIDAIRNVAIRSLLYCEEKYDHDDQARLNLEALLATIEPDAGNAGKEGRR